MVEATKVSALIVDDEPVARAGLRRMLGAVEWIRCAGEASSGPAAVEAFESLQPDLAFLDIQMPGFSGVEVLHRARHRPLVVFTTAYSEHAAAAFELGALDYLLKPFGDERLQGTLARVRAALGEPVPAPVDRLAEVFSRTPMSRLFVRTGRRIVPIALADIARFEAMGDYVIAHVGTSQHVLHLAMAQLQNRLDAKRFVRIHRAHLVNLDHVAAFRRQPSGLVAEMKDGGRLPVSRARALELRAIAR